MLRPYRAELASVTADKNSVRVLLRELGPIYRLDTSGRLLYKNGFLVDVGPGEFLLIAIPLLTFLGAFTKGFGNKLGEQSAEVVGKLFSDWLKRIHKDLNKEAPTHGGDVRVFIYLTKREGSKLHYPPNFRQAPTVNLWQSVRLGKNQNAIWSPTSGTTMAAGMSSNNPVSDDSSEWP